MQHARRLAFNSSSSWAVFLVPLVLIVGCEPAPEQETATLGGTSPLRYELEFAARRTGVPAALLAAVAYVETRLAARADGVPSRQGGFGMMHLRAGQSLERASQLTGIGVEQLKRHVGSNILGAARVLAELGRQGTGRLPRQLSAWREALGRYSGNDGAAAQAFAGQVLQVLRDGVSATDDQGQSLLIPPQPALRQAELPPGIGTLQQASKPDYSGAQWLGPACCYSSRSTKPTYVIVHTCQGTFSGCWGWLKGCHDVSAHYVVSSAGKVVQLVEEKYKAWHVGCLNSASVGIEHEGYVDNPSKWYTDKMYCASAKLTRSICKRLGVPCDRNHVIGHNEANAKFCHGSHTDPGSGWNWSKYMGYVKNGCGEPQFPKLSISAEVSAISDQERDFCLEGDSENIFDWKVGQQTVVRIDVKNSGNQPASNTRIGIWAEQPYLQIAKWNIYSNWKTGGGFELNDTDEMQDLGHDNPPKQFELWLGGISPGETKRIKLKVGAKQFSIGEADHPDVRAWVAHIDDFYDKADFAAKPTNVGQHQTQNGGNLRDYVQTDIYSDELCDEKDNDCDGEVDELCSGAGSDQGVEGLLQWAWDVDAGPGTDGATAALDSDVMQGGCELGGGGRDAGGGLLLLAGLALALALARRRCSPPQSRAEHEEPS